jgi:hypothetical protein
VKEIHAKHATPRSATYFIRMWPPLFRPKCEDDVPWEAILYTDVA